MTYTQKLQASKTLLTAIQLMKDGESIAITYGGKEYTIRCNVWSNKASYSVNEAGMFGRGMNVDKVGRTTLSLYTYDMMGQKTTYTLPLFGCTILPEKE